MDISKTFDNIIDLFKGKEESVLGLDLGGSSIKVVQARKKNGRAVLETYGEVALGPYMGMEIGRAVKLSEDKLIEALTDVLREANTTTRESGVAIPLSSSIVNTIKIPKVSKDSLEQTISLEARKYIPVPLSEVSLDWQIISENVESDVLAVTGISGETTDELNQPTVKPEGLQEVLVVAVHKDLIGGIKQVLEKKEINTRFMELESFSVARSLVDDYDSTVLIVDLGASSTKIYVFEQGNLKVSHNISIGAQDVTLSISRATGMPIAEAERVKRAEGFNFHRSGPDGARLFYGSLSYIFSEIVKTIKTYETKSNKIIKEVILTGGGANLKGLDEALKKITNTPARLAHSFAKLDYPAFMDKVIKEAGPSFSVACGAVLRVLEERD